MKRIILLAAAALPLVVHAEGVPDKTPPPGSYLVIDVDFWGTITNVTEGSRRAGDTVSGSMRIDTRYAPSDFLARNQSEALYTWNPPCEESCGPEVAAPSRFVTTRGLPVSLGSNSRDSLSIQDVYEGNGFHVEDVESGHDSSGAFREIRVSLTAASSIASSSLADFISTDRISWLDFDLVPSEATDSHAHGRWQSVVDGLSSIFDFSIDRLRATPKVCRL